MPLQDSLIQVSEVINPGDTLSLNFLGPSPPDPGLPSPTCAYCEHKLEAMHTHFLGRGALRFTKIQPEISRGTALD